MKTAIYTLVGAFHYVFRRKFLAITISIGAHNGEAETIPNVRTPAMATEDVTTKPKDV